MVDDAWGVLRCKSLITSIKYYERREEKEKKKKIFVDTSSERIPMRVTNLALRHWHSESLREENKNR
jgi:hypothetical protein